MLFSILHTVLWTQYSTYTLLQNDNFIRITFVGKLLSGGCQNCEGGCQTNVLLLLRNLSADLLIFIKSTFLRILNSSQSFQEQMMTSSSCNYTIRERKKQLDGYSCTRIYFNIYLCITYFIWFMTSYTMRRTCVPRKVRRSTELRGVRRSPELFARSTDFRVPELLIFPVLSTCGKWKLVFARYSANYFLHSNCTYISKWMSFCIGAVFSDKNMVHLLVTSLLSGNTNLSLIRSTYSKSNLAIESPAILLLLILSV